MRLALLLTALVLLAAAWSCYRTVHATWHPHWSVNINCDRHPVAGICETR